MEDIKGTEGHVARLAAGIGEYERVLMATEGGEIWARVSIRVHGIGIATGKYSGM